MKTKRFCKSLVVLMCAMICVLSSVFVCSAAQRYTITEIDDMTVYLPDDMSAVTRQSTNTDRYFAVFGLDYDATMQNFKNGDIYLQGMDSFASTTVTVTMTKTDESKGIGNYTLLDEAKLREVSNNFLAQSEYTSCTADTAEDIVWLIFSTEVNNNGTNIKAYQANTVYNGMSVNITLQRNAGDVTAQDYATFTEIVSSAEFLKTNAITGIEPYIIIGVAVGAIIILILLIIIVKKIKKHSKKNKNDKILEELAGKYTNKRNKEAYAEVDYSEYDISDDEEPAVKDIEEDVKIYREENPQPKFDSVVSDSEIDEILEYTRAEEKAEKIYTDSTPEVIYSNSRNAKPEKVEKVEKVEEIVAEEPEKITESVDKDVLTEIGDDFFGKADETDEDDYDTDEELIRQESKQTRFKDSDDFFEEAPKKTMGVISSKDIRDAEDFDVINEVEKRVTEVEKPSSNAGDAFVGTMKKIGGGFKSFGTHFGYFCTNVSRMLKKRHAKKKREKEEEQRRERARMRAERERARRQQMQNGELVRVHSRTDRRPPQNRRNTQQRRPSNTQNRNRRPDSSQRRR